MWSFCIITINVFRKEDDIHSKITVKTNGFGIYFQGGDKYDRDRGKQHLCICCAE